MNIYTPNIIQVQKERDLEGDKYKDKEAFVTSAYRQKLEEMKMAEEAEKREEYLESIGDVTKQRDLGLFFYLFLFLSYYIQFKTLIYKKQNQFHIF